VDERILYDKLARDRIPEIIRRSGRRCETEPMGEAEFRRTLRTELIEEANEASQTEPQDLAAELADVLELVDALAEAYELPSASVRAQQDLRRSERGE